MKKVGVLALQGDFEMHMKMLRRMGVPCAEVRDRGGLAKVNGLIIPGGETTTLDKLLRSGGLGQAISDRFHRGALPVYGTCMGMILLAAEIDKYPELFRFGFIDMKVARNAYGRQVDSFEADVKIAWGNGTPGGKYHAVFIRAPQILKVGKGVKVLARHAGVPVLVAQGDCLAGSFHPELTDDDRVHRFFVEKFVKRQ